MSSDYDSIRAANLKEYGHGERHLAMLGKLYSDRTHFIFELLQNAEDAGAHAIHFALHTDRLEVMHDGRPFNQRDVEGICGVGLSSKTDDLTQIGKFGIGFKSVYAYTRNPEIYSGSEYFRIEAFVRPHGISPQPIAKGFTTRFVLPFNATLERRDLEIESTLLTVPELAVRELSARLSELSPQNLLFLRQLTSLSFQLPDGRVWQLETERRADGKAQQVYLLKSTSDRSQSEAYDEEHWLVYTRPVSIEHDPANEVTHTELRVEIAFRFQRNDPSGRIRIEPLSASPLFVFFATDKPTGLNFLLQGPFRTTPARDNVPETDPWNQKLMGELALLMRDVLFDLRDRQLIDVHLLTLMPIDVAKFSDKKMFRPIYNAVRQALREERLLPSEAPLRYITAREARLARGDRLTEVFEHETLRKLLKNPSVSWLPSGIRENATPALNAYMMRELGVHQLTPDDLARAITESLLVVQTDDWLRRFYGWLGGHESLWKSYPHYYYERPGVLRNAPIIRLEDGSHVEAFDRDTGRATVFLPGDIPSGYPTVRRTLVNDDDARVFLQRFGLSEPDSTDEVFHTILPKYATASAQDSPIGDDEYERDIQKIIHAVVTERKRGNHSLWNRAHQVNWVRVVSDSGFSTFTSPTSAYLPTTELKLYFTNKSDIWFVDPRYMSFFMSPQSAEFSIIKTTPRLLDHSETCPEYIRENNSYKWREKIIDYDIEHLDDFLRLTGQSLPASDRVTAIRTLITLIRYLWFPKILDQLTARYEYVLVNTRKTRHKNYDSLIIRRLKETPWLPNEEGQLFRPSEIFLEDLADEIRILAENNSQMFQHLGLRKAVDVEYENEHSIKISAEKLGIPVELARILRNNPEKAQSFLEELKRKLNKPAFPTRKSANPERRQERMAAQAAEATTRQYEKRERSTRTSTGAVEQHAYLRAEYTNDEGQMICQMCEEEMPFRKRDGSYYFEARELLSDVLTREHEAQYIALCPVCAAKYGEYVKSQPAVMSRIMAQLSQANDRITLPDVPGVATLRFTETHLIGLRALSEGWKPGE